VEERDELNFTPFGLRQAELVGDGDGELDDITTV
jgi:hypothetical protein